MAFLLFLKTGFTACLGKTLKITPFLSFTHPHLNLLGRSEGLAFELQGKSFGRKRPWARGAGAQGSLGAMTPRASWDARVASVGLALRHSGRALTL